MNVEVLNIRKQNVNFSAFNTQEDQITVRFIGEPIKIYQYFFNPEPPKVDLDKEGWKFSNEEESRLNFIGSRKRKPKLNLRELIGDRPWVIFKEDNFEKIEDYKPVERMGCFVIDKEDENKLKVFASPVSVITKLKRICGKGPIGEFIVEVAKRGSGMNTNYEVRSLSQSRLTLKEEKMVNGTCPICSPIDILVHNKEVEIIYEEYEEIEDRVDILDL